MLSVSLLLFLNIKSSYLGNLSIPVLRYLALKVPISTYFLECVTWNWLWRKYW